MKQITFRLKPGQLLKEEIEKLAVEEEIGAGVLVSIVGNLDKAVLRMAGATPGNDVIKDLPGPFEIVSGTGTISKNGCHIHMSVSDKEGNVLGGHLKDGCAVKYTCEVVILVFDDVEYKRVKDEKTGYGELSI